MHKQKLIRSKTKSNPLKKKKKQEKGLIDTIAAVLILQDFMKMYQNGDNTEKTNGE